MVNRRCQKCGFKFKQEHGKGRPAKNCGTCRKDAQDKWRGNQAAKETQKSVGKIPPNEL